MQSLGRFRRLRPVRCLTADSHKRQHLGPGVSLCALGCLGQGIVQAHRRKIHIFPAVPHAYEETAKAGELATLARELAKVESGQKILFIFGPEGGISPSEIDAFEEAGGLKIGLGPRIMRTETAPLYALSSVSYALELNK